MSNPSLQIKNQSVPIVNNTAADIGIEHLNPLSDSSILANLCVIVDQKSMTAFAVQNTDNLIVKIIIKCQGISRKCVRSAAQYIHCVAQHALKASVLQIGTLDSFLRMEVKYRG